MTNSWKKIELFQGLTKQELNLLGNFFVNKKYHHGDLIFRDGQKSDKLIIIDSGQAALQATLGNKIQNIALFKKLDFIGELSLVQEITPHQHKLRVETATLNTWELSSRSWYTIIKKNPKLKEKIWQKIILGLHKRLEHADNKLLALFSIGQYLTGQHDLKAISNYILQTILNIIPSRQALLCSYSNTTKKIHIYEVINYLGIEKNKYYPLRNFPILKDIIEKPRTLIFRSQDLPQGPVLWSLSSKQTIITPILAGQKVIGFIILSDKNKNQEYSPNNIILLEAAANQLAAIIQNIRRQEWEEASQSLKREYIDLPY